MTAEAAQAIERAASAMRNGEPLAPADAARLAAAFEQFLAGDAERLDTALGLTGRGHDWRAELATSRRNELLREAVRQFGPPAGEGRAAWLKEKLDRYRASAWRHDRAKASPPLNALKAKLWLALRQADRDLKLSAIKQIIKDTETG